MRADQALLAMRADQALLAMMAAPGVTMVAKRRRRHSFEPMAVAKTTGDSKVYEGSEKDPVTVEDGRRGVADDRPNKSSTKSSRAPKRMKKSCGGGLKLDRDLIWHERDKEEAGGFVGRHRSKLTMVSRSNLRRKRSSAEEGVGVDGGGGIWRERG